MVLDQLIAEAEATLRQRELQQEEVRRRWPGLPPVCGGRRGLGLPPVV